MTPDDWRRALDGSDSVVNAAGALRDGPRDDLDAVHRVAVERLVRAAPPGLRILQISAAGGRPDASTVFLRTKSAGDAAVMESALDWVILRPGLVVGPQAYGGTAALRAMAALPIGLALPFAGEIRAVGIEDVARAAVDAVEGRVPAGTLADLAETGGRSVAETLATFRRWLGLPPPAIVVPIPSPLLSLAGRIADLAAWLGWRPPLRTTALRVMREGIPADPEPWRRAGGTDPAPLPDILAAMPATVQERWFARIWPLLPLTVATLAAFWTASGAIALADPGAAASVLTERGLDTTAALAAVAGGALADIALGLAILLRPLARLAALGMVALSTAYLAAATLVAPDLWADPLGPLVKVVPAMVLALALRALLDER